MRKVSIPSVLDKMDNDGIVQLPRLMRAKLGPQGGEVTFGVPIEIIESGMKGIHSFVLYAVKKADFDRIKAEMEVPQAPTLFSVFSAIKLDIEGSNLAKTGWMPSESDKEFMPENNYLLAVEECNAKNEKVLFTNVSLLWDSCDCSSGYCSHGSYVYEIEVNADQKYVIEYEDGDHLCFEGHRNMAKIPVSMATVWDFYRACELCGIKLEMSDYAISLLSPN